ncbi:MAG TPA: hypothetical protein VF756_10360 [Thermoanaerobaculia bacterium]
MAEKGKIWELLGKSVRWEEVVRHAPKIVEAARVLYESNRQRQQRSAEPSRPSHGPDPAAALKTRLADLEAQVRRLQENETQQAALVSDMAKQLEAVTKSLEALIKRTTLFFWVSGAALLLGLTGVILALLR